MADSWRSDPPDGRRYWFHLHTVYTHGRSTVRDYLEVASELGVDEVVFLEHVRRRPSYDTDAFVAEVGAEAGSVGLMAYVGFEAKILAGGHLDIDERLLESADTIGIAEHGYSGSADALAGDFIELIGNATEHYPRQSFVWVHPGSWMKRSGESATSPAYRRMREAALSAGVRIERNLKYDLVSADEFQALEPETRVVGLDAHSAEEARTRWLALGSDD